MTKCWNALWKKAVPLLAGGMLLQAGGCGLDPATVVTEWLTAIASDAIGGVVFRNFNLIT